jgi:hypothetical protein
VCARERPRDARDLLQEVISRPESFIHSLTTGMSGPTLTVTSGIPFNSSEDRNVGRDAMDLSYQRYALDNP